MSSYTIAFITFGSVTAGVLLGVLLRATLPDAHFRDDSKDIIKTAAGLMATLVALVIGLLVGSAKEAFDASGNGLSVVGSKVITLDRVLSRYGPETKEMRAELHQAIKSAVANIWETGEAPTSATPGIDLVMAVEQIHDRMRDLTPKNDAQRIMQGQALSLSNEIVHALWLLIEQAQGEPPMAFIVVLIFWLTVLFLSFGLLSARNTTAMCAMLVCAASISCAIFLILEMNSPFRGAIQIPSTPLSKAIGLMNR